MKRNYELNELNKFQRLNLAAKTTDGYESDLSHSYQFATKLQNSIRYDLSYSCNS